jgi:DNA helicase IV
VPDADLPRAVRQTGVAPAHEIVTADDLVPGVLAVVTALTAEVEGTIGVITPAARLSAIQSEVDNVNRVQVVDGMQAKGMEYDGVVVVAPEEIAAESSAGVRVLYVALTRATHRLITVSTTDDWRP